MARIIVTGLIAQHRSMGGVAWDYLNVVLGLRQLGHDVYYFEDSGEWPYLESGPPGEPWIAHDPSAHLEYLAQAFESFGLGDRWAYRFPIRDEWFGLPEDMRRDVVESADVLLNVSGTLEFPDKYAGIPNLVYIDTDPVFTQIAVRSGGEALKQRGALGLRVCGPGEVPDEKLIEGWSREEKLRRCVDLHTIHFTVGETVQNLFGGAAHEWLPTKHPIALSEWCSEKAYRDVYTTVANWTSYSPVHADGVSYGQKDVEMIRFIDLAKEVAPVALEVAMPSVHHVSWQSEHEYVFSASGHSGQDLASETPQSLLRRYEWSVVPAGEICGDFTSYRDYLQHSKAEFSVAKHGYVEGRSGWFSGRSACYLAAGRPVVVQDTAFGDVLPTGEGVLAFSTIGEARDGIREVEGDYKRHSRAAAAIAAEYFESGKVLGRMLDAC